MDASRALAWRRARQFLETGAGSAAEVVRRLVAVPSWSGDPDLAVRRRLARPSPGALADAVADGELIRTYAFRGATHLFAPEDAGVHMAVRCANRQWELRSWQEHYDLRPQDWPALREAVRDVVAQGPVRQPDLAARVAEHPRFRHLRAALSHPGHTLLKPLAWQGDICFGPTDDGQPTFRSPASVPGWTGLPDLDDAGRRAVVGYLAAYGPATRDNLHYWLVAGLSAGRRRVEGWIADLTADRIAEIEIDGSPALHLHEHLDALAAADPDPDEVTLLPGYDQWVLGPGTADPRIVAAGRRPAVTRGANVALRAGRVAATWRIDRSTLSVAWFAEDGPPPHAAIEAEAARLCGLLDRELTTAVTVA